MDVAENLNDTEEAVWHLLAMARTEGLGKARPQMIKMGRDPRRVMSTVEEAFRNGDAESIGALEATNATDGGAGDRFYACFISRATGPEAAPGSPRGVGGLDARGGGQPRVRFRRLHWRLAKVHRCRRKGATIAVAGPVRAELVVGGLQRDILPSACFLVTRAPRGTARGGDDVVVSAHGGDGG